MDSVFRSQHAIHNSYHDHTAHQQLSDACSGRTFQERLEQYLPAQASQCLSHGELRHYANVAENVFREMAFTLDLPYDKPDEAEVQKIRQKYCAAAAGYLARKENKLITQTSACPFSSGLRRNKATLDLQLLCEESRRTQEKQSRDSRTNDEIASPLFFKDLYLAYFYSILHQELVSAGSIDWNDRQTQQQITRLSSLLRQGLYQREIVQRNGVSPHSDFTGTHDLAALAACYAPIAETMGIELSQCPEFGLRFSIEKNIMNAVKREWGFPDNNPLMIFMFDVEKNYALGMANAWHAAHRLINLLSEGSKLSSKDLEALHAICLKGISHNNGKSPVLGMGRTGVSYSMVSGRGLTSEGVGEWIAGVKKLNRLCEKAIQELELPSPENKLISLHIFTDLYQPDELEVEMKRNRLYGSHCVKGQSLVVKWIADKLIEEFYSAMEAAEAASNSLHEARMKRCLAIVDLCQQLERLHPFSDGNGRLFEFLLPNVLLLAYGFEAYAPVTPYLIDGASRKEVLEEFLEGQAMVQEMRAKAPRGEETGSVNCIADRFYML